MTADDIFEMHRVLDKENADPHNTEDCLVTRMTRVIERYKAVQSRVENMKTIIADQSTRARENDAKLAQAQRIIGRLMMSLDGPATVAPINYTLHS